MQIKLDENLGWSAQQILKEKGLEVSTVHEQGFCGKSDHELIKACHLEGRVLVTLDLDFANPIVFDPARYSGIVVLKMSSRYQKENLTRLLQMFSEGIKGADIKGKLWIVEVNRIREYSPET